MSVINGDNGIALVSRSQTPPLFDIWMAGRVQMSKRGGVWLRETRIASCSNNIIIIIIIIVITSWAAIIYFVYKNLLHSYN